MFPLIRLVVFPNRMCAYKTKSSLEYLVVFFFRWKNPINWFSIRDAEEVITR